jgi:hypothetical protein
MCKSCLRRLRLLVVQLEGELYNGRVAMLAVVGILNVEALGRGPWWQAYNTVRSPERACLSDLHLTVADPNKDGVLAPASAAAEECNHGYVGIFISIDVSFCNSWYAYFPAFPLNL